MDVYMRIGSYDPIIARCLCRAKKVKAHDSGTFRAEQSTTECGTSGGCPSYCLLTDYSSSTTDFKSPSDTMST